MARNAEVIRQWGVLRELASSRNGCTIGELAEKSRVTTRTTRRDLAALEQAGFALTDVTMGGARRWRLIQQPFSHLTEAGFTLMELCALYFSRSLVECLAGTPFQEDLRSAFRKLEGSLGAQTRKYLDKLPAVLATQLEPMKKREQPGQQSAVARLITATLGRQKVIINYHSFSSGRIKDYSIEPYRLAYSQGGIYLFAFVPEYGQMRTFAVERVKRLTLLDEHFDAVQPLSAAPFPDSMGPHHGRPVRVAILFSPKLAPYILERNYHPSQKTEMQDGGSVLLTLRVSIDWTLTSWILSFGPFARVVEPASLADQIRAEIEEARDQYTLNMKFDSPTTLYDLNAQLMLPLGREASPRLEPSIE
jgi:predicted DNA-binding transcriptional regulator YafY